MDESEEESTSDDQDTHDLWVEYCWLGPRSGRRWYRHLHGWPSHGERGPEDQLHHQAADRAGEGVPLQQVPDAGEAGGDRQRPAAQRDAGESLVSEQTHEAEEITERRAGPRPGAPGTALTRRQSGHLPLSWTVLSKTPELLSHRSWLMLYAARSPKLHTL